MNELIENLNIKIFADGANLDDMFRMNSESYIGGLTTNPTLMRKSGITNYSTFAMEALEVIVNKPISFEVFSDDLQGMIHQAREISSWGKNVYVKIPITNTRGMSTIPVIETLVNEEIKVNVTAVMTETQIQNVISALSPRIPSYISVFAGRIADTGVDPLPIMKNALSIMAANTQSELIWASPRELLNIFQADSIGCHIITATTDILSKITNVGKDLDAYSLETVKMFRNDAEASGYRI